MHFLVDIGRNPRVTLGLELDQPSAQFIGAFAKFDDS
jgi:hypothetical protein